MPSEVSQASSITETEGDETTTSNQPVNALYLYRIPRLPVEVYELVIDWIVIITDTTLIEELRETTKNLSNYSLVCRAWRIRAQAHLFKKISLNYEGLPSLNRVLLENHLIHSNIEEMYIKEKSRMKSISFFAIRHRLPNLIYLNMSQLDLTREHRWLHRAPLFRSVQRLKLSSLQNCQLSQLILFINAFPSLTRLDIGFGSTRLEHKDQILPKPFRNDTRSLKWLDVELIPGSSKLIEWLFKAKPCPSQLTTLILYVDDRVDEVQLISSFNTIKELLRSCSNSIEDLRLHLVGVPMVESVSDIIRLDWLPRLRYLTYGSPGKGFVLPYAVRQLGATTTHQLIKVTFDIVLGNTEKQLDAALCDSIDDLLSGDKFPSLETVFLHGSVPVILFPKLSNTGLLQTLTFEESCWGRGQMLPNLLCERMIGWVHYGSSESKWKWNEGIKTLIACSLVCREWRNHVQTYLSKPMEVSGEELKFFSDALVKDPRISWGIRTLVVAKKFNTTPISPFAIQHTLRHLDYLIIHNLDLTREHLFLYRAPLFRSVRKLKLYRLRSYHLSQLIRLINAFPSLFKLELEFSFDKLEFHGQILPRSCQSEARALTWLQLDLKPGISGLIDWFLISEPFLAQLKTLVLFVWDVLDEEDFTSSFKGVEGLLDRCRNTLEDLRVHVNEVPMVKFVSDRAELDSFPNLKYLTYGTYKKDVVLPYVIRRLGAITSKSNLTRVNFDLSLDHKNQPDRELCTTLDGLLTGGKFPSLRKVGLRRNIPHELFPQLNAAGRLVVLDWSFWKDPPVAADEDGSDVSGERNNEKNAEGEESGEHIRDTADEGNDGPGTTTKGDEKSPLALPESYD